MMVPFWTKKKSSTTVLNQRLEEFYIISLVHLQHVKWSILFRGKINFPLKSAAGHTLLYDGVTWSHSFDSRYIFSLGLFTKENDLG
uniref:Uncharacterized protein n=1 Tax=Triticum urartu TaxID=4572 RepID=A0A8R7QY56_TRIUA